MKKTIYAFGNAPYCDALKAACDPNNLEVLYVSDEQAEKPSYAQSPEDICSTFESLYQPDQNVVACVNLARGSVIKGVENIAKAWDLIKQAHPQLSSAAFIGPSYEAAQIFTHKNAMAQLFQQLQLDTPQTVLIPDQADNDFFDDLIKSDFPFPAVIKAPELSGGRGMVLVGSVAELTRVFKQMRSEGHSELVLSEFIEGIEVSFAVLRLGDSSLYLPACYKEPTAKDLTHPDNKVKMTGAFKKFDAVYARIEKFMKQKNMQGLLYLEAILQKSADGAYQVKFLEGAARISGNSPIEFAALRDFDFYKTLAVWIDTKVLEPKKEERLCIQYASYQHHGPQDVAALLQLPYVIEAKYEDMGNLPFAENKRSRIRVSFVGENFVQAKERAEHVARIMAADNYATHIHDVFSLYKEYYPDLIETSC